MKNKLKLVLGAMLTAGLLATGASYAGDSERDREVIRIKAELGESVKVFVGDDGEHQKYDFTSEELENLENVEAELGDLDESLRKKVIDLLSKLSLHPDAKIIEMKDMDITKGEHESSIFMLKTGNEDDALHIEIDVEGEAANPEKQFRIAKILANGHGSHKSVHKGMKWHMGKGDKKQMAKVLKKLIKRADLSPEEVEELRALLDEK